MLKRQASGITTINNNKPFAPLLVFFFTALIILYAVGVRYGDTEAEEETGGYAGVCGARMMKGVLGVWARAARGWARAPSATV